MKHYCVELSIGGTTLVEADACEQDDWFVQFLRDGYVVSRYPRATVKKFCEQEPPSLNGVTFLTAEAGESPPPTSPA